jgi:hypothetical protein
MSASFLPIFYACALLANSERLTIDSGFFLEDATLAQAAEVYRFARDRLMIVCHDCFAEAYDLDERLECDKQCAIGDPITFNQLIAVYEDVRERLPDECYECFDYPPLPLQHCQRCIALGIEAGVAGDSSDWNLPMRLWLSQLPTSIKENIAEFLARELFTADNTFFRANEQRCQVSADYCSRTYGLRLVVEDYDYYADKLNERILELEGVLDQRECEVDVLSRLLDECKNQLSEAETEIADDIEMLDRVLIKI